MFSHTYASDELQRSDLSQLVVSASQEKLPILLIVSQHHCPFCVRLKEEIIYSMQLSGNYEDKVIIAETLLDSTNTILDLEGNSVMPGEIGNSYGGG